MLTWRWDSSDCFPPFLSLSLLPCLPSIFLPFFLLFLPTFSLPSHFSFLICFPFATIWMFMFPQIHILKSPKWWYLESFGGYWVMKVEPWWMGLAPLSKDPGESTILSTMCDFREKTDVWEMGLTRHWICWHHDFRLWSLQNCDK